MSACPDEAKISDFVSRTLPTLAAAQIEAHLADCGECRDLVFALASSSVEQAEHAEVSRVGRFELGDVIGRGAMGLVYRARDPELARDVAVKLRLGGGKLDVAAEERLRREAQALARLAHPNVVTVHEAGRHDELTYVAMEYVDGVTLEDWLRTPRSQRAILDVLIGAGRGLAAAHASGLVHRDFKPRNVFVSRANVAKVGDFGLVRSGDDQPAEAAVSELALSLSVTGSLIGTPAYMAPEQLRGELATEASDQFSFCVTLFEAIYRRRPFAHDGQRLDQLLAAMQQPVVIPRKPRVPRTVRRVLARGLAIEPAARFASMDALLAVLVRRPNTGAWVATSAALAAITVAGTLWAARDRGATCTGAERELDGIWDAGRRSALAGAFTATGHAHAAEIAQRTQALLDRQATGWIAASRAACEATRVRGVETEAMLELRTACLAERRAELRAVTDLLVHADRDTLDHAIGAASSLPSLDQCADLPTLQQVVRPPADLVRRGQVEARRAELAHARALLGIARADQTVARLRPMVDATRALGYAPLHADALTLYGGALHDLGKDDDAIRVLRDAIAAADAGGDDRARFEAWDRLLIVFLFVRRTTELDDALAQARAVLDRIPYDAELQHRWRLREGMTLVAQSQPQRAIPKFRELIAVLERTQPVDDALLAETWTMLADALARSEQPAEAQAALRRGEELLARAYGPGHAESVEARSEAAKAQLFQGLVLVDQKQPAEALAVIEPARAQLIRIHGPDHESVGMAEHVVAVAYRALGRNADARIHHQRALDIHRAVHGDDNIKVAAAYSELALIEYDEQNFDRAAELLAKTYAIWVKTRGADSMQAAATDLWTARALIAAGRLDEAARSVTRTRALTNKFGKMPAVLALDGEILILRGRTDQGMALLDRAFAIPSKGDWIGHAHLVMARALATRGRTADARKHVDQAIADFATRGEQRRIAEARAFAATLAR